MQPAPFASVATASKPVRRVDIALAALFLGAFAGCASVAPDPTQPPGDADRVAVAREIEEADIVKYVDGYFYLSNAYTGLRIIDARNIDEPAFAGRTALAGRGVELIVRDDHVFIFNSADFNYCAGEPVGFDDGLYDNVGRPGYEGTRLSVIDVSDKAAPFVRLTVDFDGFVVGTRRVGDVLYAAGNIGTSVFVVSFDIADPASVEIVENRRFTSRAQDIYVAADAIYVIGDDPDLVETTLVTCIDISSPAGEIVLRDSFRVPGRVRNRFYVDAFENTFRLVTEEFNLDTFTNTVALYVYDVSNPDNVIRIARLPIITDESLRAVRFDGPRAYAVTFRVVDPLFVLDLSDPSAPVVAGELEVPGFSTHLVPLGDRLVGVGFATGTGLEPAVSLYDVTNPANPRQLDRVVVEGFRRFDTSSSATVDEKALGVLPDDGLILLPYARFDDDLGDFIDGVQLIEFDAQNLHERGQVEHRGLVRRSGVQDARMWVLSDLAFQVVDIFDLDAPGATATLDIISDQELLDAGLSACADSARYAGTNLFLWPGFGGFACGAWSPVMIATTAAAIGLLRLHHRRRYGRTGRGSD